MLGTRACVVTPVHPISAVKYIHIMYVKYVRVYTRAYLVTSVHILSAVKYVSLGEQLLCWAHAC